MEVRRFVSQRCLWTAVVAIALVCASSDLTASVDARAKPTISAIAPSWVRAAAPVTVRGRVVRRPRLARIVLQQKIGKRWKTRSTARLRGIRYALRLRAPSSPQTLRLRVAVRVGRRTVAVSRLIRTRVQLIVAPGAPRPGAQRPAGSPLTRVLPADVVLSTPAPGQPGELRLRGSVPVTPGDVLVTGVGSNTPSGLLVRAVSVRDYGSFTSVSTVPATLQEAVADGAVDTSVNLGDHGAAAELTDPEEATAGAKTLLRSVKASVTCTNGAKVRVAGSVSLNPTAKFSARWSLLKGLESVNFEAAAVATAGLEATAEGSADCSIVPITLAKWRLSPITVMAGPVPVVFVPEVELTLFGGGKVSAAVTAGIQGSFSASAGQNWTKADGFRPLGAHTATFHTRLPTTHVTGELRSGVHSDVNLLLYGVAGPSFAVVPQFYLYGWPNSWSLRALISVQASLKVPALGLNGELLQVDLYDNTLANWSRQPPPEAPAGSAERLGGVDLSAYCRSQGWSRAGLDGPEQGPNAAYGWRCIRNGQQTGLSVDEACRRQYGRPNAVSRADNVDDAFSWACIG